MKKSGRQSQILMPFTLVRFDGQGLAIGPDRPWQIATSDKHSTVVDLERELLFDPTFQALGLTPEECWKEALSWHNTELLPIGNLMIHDLEAAA